MNVHFSRKRMLAMQDDGDGGRRPPRPNKDLYGGAPLNVVKMYWWIYRWICNYVRQTFGSDVGNLIVRFIPKPSDNSNFYNLILMRMREDKAWSEVVKYMGRKYEE